MPSDGPFLRNFIFTLTTLFNDIFDNVLKHINYCSTYNMYGCLIIQHQSTCSFQKIVLGGNKLEFDFQ